MFYLLLPLIPGVTFNFCPVSPTGDYISESLGQHEILMLDWVEAHCSGSVWMGSHRVCLTFGFLASHVSKSGVAC